MFGMFTVKKKIETPAEQRLEDIKNILFPPSDTRQSVDKETGEKFKFLVDYSADMNLDSALYDIREGYADGPVQDTIKDISDRLFQVRQILEAEANVDHEARYIIVDNKKSDDLDEIVVPEE